ncbi:MAG: hypothetical protein MMC23_004245 [Stictis urceolatum]|nr:hypothetical protein [Stictis urceolata]
MKLSLATLIAPLTLLLPVLPLAKADYWTVQQFLDPDCIVPYENPYPIAWAPGCTTTQYPTKSYQFIYEHGAAPVPNANPLYCTDEQEPALRYWVDPHFQGMKEKFQCRGGMEGELLAWLEPASGACIRDLGSSSLQILCRTFDEKNGG